MPILDAIYKACGVSDSVVSIGTGVVRRGDIKMNRVKRNAPGLGFLRAIKKVIRKYYSIERGKDERQI